MEYGKEEEKKLTVKLRSSSESGGHGSHVKIAGFLLLLLFGSIDIYLAANVGVPPVCSTSTINPPLGGVRDRFLVARMWKSQVPLRLMP
jgi:hypothetical protein